MNSDALELDNADRIWVGIGRMTWVIQVLWARL